MKRPLIGVTVDSSCAKHYSDYPWYGLRKNYCDSIDQTGGIPILIPHNIGLIDHYLDLIDGIVVTGGDFDHDPKMYGEDFIHPTTKINAERSTFDYAIVKRTLERDIPFLGICAGQQMLNIVRGGTIIQSIQDEAPHALNHSQEKCRHQPSHNIKITNNSLLYRLNKNKEDAAVNTSHHQSVKDVGNGLNSTAVSTDGIIEAIEDPNLRFCLGVQWHPEFFSCDLDREIYKQFILTCGAQQDQQSLTKFLEK